MAVNVLQLQEYLEGLDFPVSKEDMVRRAQENGAGTAVLQLLRSLPADQFASAQEVGESLSELA
ncbi:DUF2795 domain-containing protein [Plantactinospora sp. GCM10030261]|uniref:DUF2795 domain-containing protein n=1 Tax=Plantactinospora sp. GCM10030261 TaxID=3273420 RepID=UPI003623C622